MAALLLDGIRRSLKGIGKCYKYHLFIHFLAKLSKSYSQLNKFTAVKKWNKSQNKNSNRVKM